MNKVMIIGFLGRDPETRYLQSGQAVTEFSVATTERWRDKNTQEQRESTEWFNVVAWGRQAEVCAEYLRKGSRVFVEGKQQTDTWDDRETGEKRYRTKLRLDRFEFLTPRGEGGGQRPEQSIAGHENTQPATAATADEEFDDDIPF